MHEQDRRRVGATGIDRMNPKRRAIGVGDFGVIRRVGKVRQAGKAIVRNTSMDIVSRLLRLIWHY
jgi:hypothetical protein